MEYDTENEKTFYELWQVLIFYSYMERIYIFKFILVHSTFLHLRCDQFI